MDEEQRPLDDGIPQDPAGRPPVPVPRDETDALVGLDARLTAVERALASNATSMPSAADAGWDELFAPADIVDALDRLVEDAIPRLERLAGIDVSRLKPLPVLSGWIDEVAESRGLDDRKVRVLRLLARATHPYTGVAIVPLRALAANAGASVRVVSRDLRELRRSSLVWIHRRRGGASAYELAADRDGFPDLEPPNYDALGLYLLRDLYRLRRTMGLLYPNPAESDDVRRSLQRASPASRERFRRDYLAGFFDRR